jgi:hypothetical protein
MLRVHRGVSSTPRSPLKVGALTGLLYVACSVPLRLLWAGEDIGQAAAMTSCTVGPVAVAASLGTFVRDRRPVRKARPAKR